MARHHVKDQGVGPYSMIGLKWISDYEDSFSTGD